MSWITRRGITVWDGAEFPEPTDEELAPYVTPPKVIPSCGSLRGAWRHRKKGETPCAKCQPYEHAHYLARRAAKESTP